MPQCQFPIFCYFYVSEKLHWKYSQNWTKQKPKFLFFPTRNRVQSRDGGGQRAAAPCHGTGHPMTSPFRLYILLDKKPLRARTLFQKTYCKPPPSLTWDREGPEALPGTLPERGITTEGLWYVSNVSIIFDAPCLFLHHLPIVSWHLVALLCIFRN
jgi:hypothetical protein